MDENIKEKMASDARKANDIKKKDSSAKKYLALEVWRTFRECTCGCLGLKWTWEILNSWHQEDDQNEPEISEKGYRKKKRKEPDYDR
jgi:hypothetical protein